MWQIIYKERDNMDFYLDETRCTLLKKIKHIRVNKFYFIT
jgi:hypothetical protein